MRRRRAFQPLTTRTEHPLDAEDRFDFIVTGDGRPPLAHMPYTPHAATIMREAALLRPACVLYAGDAFWHYGASRQERLNDLDRFRAFAETTGVPLYNVPGNHEMQSDPEGIALLESLGQDLWGSFDVGAYHFVALNTDEFCLEGRVHGEQLDWLREDLAGAVAADTAGVFVLMHRPLHSWFQGDFNPDDAELLHELFRAHRVRGVFAAHDHFYDRRDVDGIAYLTVGGAGGPLYAQPQDGGFVHYVVVSVWPEGIGYTVVEPGHLVVDHPAGNDGLEPVTIARVLNTSDRAMHLRALPFRVPRLASRDGYRLSVDYLDWERKRPDLPLALRDVHDMGDGSVTLHVEVTVPAGVAFRVVAESRP